MKACKRPSSTPLLITQIHRGTTTTPTIAAGETTQVLFLEEVATALGMVRPPVHLSARRGGRFVCGGRGRQGTSRMNRSARIDPPTLDCGASSPQTLIGLPSLLRHNLAHGRDHRYALSLAAENSRHAGKTWKGGISLNFGCTLRLAQEAAERP